MIGSLYAENSEAVDFLAQDLQNLITSVRKTYPLGIPYGSGPIHPVTPTLVQQVTRIYQELTTLTEDLNDPLFWSTPSKVQKYGFETQKAGFQVEGIWEAPAQDALQDVLTTYRDEIKGILSWKAPAPLSFYVYGSRPTDLIREPVLLWKTLTDIVEYLSSHNIDLSDPLSVLFYFLDAHLWNNSLDVVQFQSTSSTAFKEGFTALSHSIELKMADDNMDSLDNIFKTMMKKIPNRKVPFFQQLTDHHRVLMTLISAYWKLVANIADGAIELQITMAPWMEENKIEWLYDLDD
ncbi:hypothetical protein ABW20_dc0109029 [Dactylellina cionopaga]|nr:hypothetical protein ABW20_dc0109029 [Dactylellina cionopaga]